MKKAGFYHIVLAVESASQRILDDVKKKLDLKKVPKLVKMVKKYGIVTRGFFMLGLPTETINSCYKTIKYLRKIDLDYVSIFIAQPLPGSEIFNQWKKNITLGNFDWENIEYRRSNQPLVNFNPKYLKRFRMRAYLTFFFRLRTIYTIFSHLMMNLTWFKNIGQQLIRLLITKKWFKKETVFSK